VLARTPEGVIVEIAPQASRLVDARATERLVRLEIADVDVPAPPRAGAEPPLYFRILAPTEKALRVELWELGAPYGARTVSTAGSEHLKARRLALAAAELARQLRRRRLSEIEAQKAAQSDSSGAEEQPGLPIYGRFVAEGGGRVAAIGPSGALIAGPELGAALRFSSGQRVRLSAAWLEGRASGFDSSARWLEAGLGFSQAVRLGRFLDVSAGLEAAVASLRLGSAREPGSGSPLDTWASRAGLALRVEPWLGRNLGLSFGPDAGVVLRKVKGIAPDGGEHAISGVWLGASLLVTVGPAAK
jgi:hypothetical protein